MRSRASALFVLASVFASAIIIDRIAVIVGDSIVKDSDIDRDIRVTDFLNNELLSFESAARKKAASRLIDQIFIRREIAIGDYPTATLQDTDNQLDNLKRQRFKTDAAYQHALSRYGLTDLELRTQLQWQLTVLRFIDLRFKPGALVSEEEIEKYYNEHAVALRRENPRASSLDDLREKIRGILQGRQVNQQFFAWLDDQRKENKIQFREASLA